MDKVSNYSSASDAQYIFLVDKVSNYSSVSDAQYIFLVDKVSNYSSASDATWCYIKQNYFSIIYYMKFKWLLINP